MNTSTKSILKGFFIAPAVAPIIYCLLALFMPQVREHPALNVLEWFKVLATMLLLAYTLCLLTGGPLVWLLKRLKKLAPVWLIVLGGLLYALMVYLGIFVLLNAQAQGNVSATMAGICAGAFLMGAFTYWLFCKIAKI